MSRSQPGVARPFENDAIDAVISPAGWAEGGGGLPQYPATEAAVRPSRMRGRERVYVLVYYGL
jgi:hypothetical protein